VGRKSTDASSVGAPSCKGRILGVAIDAPGSWHVLHTRSRQEKALVADLTAMGVSCMLPVVSALRYYGRRKVRVELPLFPSYVFLRGGAEDAYRADRTRRVASIIPVSDQSRLQEELVAIHRSLSHNLPLDPHPYLRKGVWVEVRSGPLKGVRGIVEDRRQNILILQVDVLGQASSLEIDGSLLEPIEEAEPIITDT